MQYRTSRQEVTGLVVNKKVNVRREYRYTVRAMVHRLLRTGLFEIYTATETSGAVPIEKHHGTVNQLHGMLGFIDSIDLYNKKNAAAPKDFVQLSRKELMYRQFLIYKEFYTAEVPVIICEGETDNVYLTHAIRSLGAEFPELAEITAQRQTRLKVRLYKYPRSSTARIIGLRDGGSGALAKFIATYKKETEKFNTPGQKNPVIILYDNDAGAKPVRSAINQARGERVAGTEPFVHVSRNLYAVPTPPVNGHSESKIEEFFEVGLKRTVVNGKTFNEGNNFDVEKNYGKKVFAYRVVREQAGTINFGGFRQLLTNLVSVIEQHAVAVSAQKGTVTIATNG